MFFFFRFRPENSPVQNVENYFRPEKKNVDRRKFATEFSAEKRLSTGEILNTKTYNNNLLTGIINIDLDRRKYFDWRICFGWRKHLQEKIPSLENIF